MVKCAKTQGLESKVLLEMYHEKNNSKLYGCECFTKVIQLHANSTQLDTIHVLKYSQYSEAVMTRKFKV